MSNYFQKPSSWVPTLANEIQGENLSGINFRKIDQNFRNSRKLGSHDFLPLQ